MIGKEKKNVTIEIKKKKKIQQNQNDVIQNSQSNTYEVHQTRGSSRTNISLCLSCTMTYLQNIVNSGDIQI